MVDFSISNKRKGNKKMSNTNESKKIVTASEIARHGYEASVMNRMQGRSGAYTKTGSKGIALEIMGTDQINVRNMANPDVSAALTKKANAPQVDVVVMNQNRVSERLQFKDVVSDTGVGNVIKRTKNGDYRSAQMYGTTESAQNSQSQNLLSAQAFPLFTKTTERSIATKFSSAPVYAPIRPKCKTNIMFARS